MNNNVSQLSKPETSFKPQIYLPLWLVILLFFAVISASFAQQKDIDSTKIKQAIAFQDSALSYMYGAQEKALDSAILMWSKAIEMDSTKVIFHQLKSYTYLRKGEAKEAISTLSDWLKKHPDDIETTLKRGMILHQTNLKTEALADFDLVRTYLLKNPIVLKKPSDSKELGIVANQLEKFILIGDNENALKIMEQIQQTFPDDKKHLKMPALPTKEEREEIIRNKIRVF
ncbi:MAG: hypothetical protein EOO47_00655 [Flavobacterium sp.]|nr:MAG: hypothetical protein EOO47_00655 [Flavobacterium sp.]